MIIIIKGPAGSGKSTFAKQLQKQMLKPSYPEIIDGAIPEEEPKGIEVEWKIFCTQEESLPDWAYESPYVIIFFNS